MGGVLTEVERGFEYRCPRRVSRQDDRWGTDLIRARSFNTFDPRSAPGHPSQSVELKDCEQIRGKEALMMPTFVSC